jgi:hypothetical protein
VAENYTEKINVRQVTDIHANWSEHGSGEPGKLSFQLVLDNGAEEHVVRTTAEDAKVLIRLINKSDSLFFDLDRKVLVLNGLE